MSKADFKQFVKNNPNLINYVNTNEMSWQKFYEMYDLYGENNDIWQKYLNSNNNNSNVGLIDNFKGIFDLFKGVDLRTVQKTLTGLDKAIGTFREFSNNDNNYSNNYEQRPTERYYED